MRLLLAVVCFIGTACAHQITGYGPQPKTLAKSNRDSVIVIVQWVKSVDDIAAHCEPVPGLILYACAAPRGPICTVWAVEPDNFDDATKLAVLGHEFWHCLGAAHEK